MSRILFALLALQLATLACSPQADKKEQIQELPVAQAVNEYPPITLKLSDGQDVAARDLKGNNVFVLFQPDCDHCQHEAVQIEQRLEEFKDYALYFI
ncbi:MAG: peroxiredoxin family protein, partial [Bacteroidota bacterium]|nr:peroxiredoxin family protein [Bacteroidota bacterium]